ncbi:MAG: acyl-CoA thioesterase [Pseudobdellovibrionaceae bacterium]
MSQTSPLIFISKDRAKFFEIDPYGHMNTQFYISHFLEHRMSCLREYLGWDLEYISKSPIAFVVKDIKVDFIRSVIGDKEFEIKSFVSEFQDKTCTVQMSMDDSVSGKVISKCEMTLACLDKTTLRTATWPEEIKSKFFVVRDNA